MTLQQMMVLARAILDLEFYVRNAGKMVNGHRFPDDVVTMHHEKADAVVSAWLVCYPKPSDAPAALVSVAWLHASAVAFAATVPPLTNLLDAVRSTERITAGLLAEAIVRHALDIPARGEDASEVVSENAS